VYLMPSHCSCATVMIYTESMDVVYPVPSFTAKLSGQRLHTVMLYTESLEVVYPMPSFTAKLLGQRLEEAQQPYNP
jgi:hypothetical protein